MSRVFDTSALLAVIFSESGAEAALEHLVPPGGEVSAANWAEVGSKLAERGLKEREIRRELAAFGLDVVPLDEAQAIAVALLRQPTRALGLSLGDRCCLALARLRGATAVTAERSWKKVSGVDVALIR